MADKKVKELLGYIAKNPELLTTATSGMSGIKNLATSAIGSRLGLSGMMGGQSALDKNVNDALYGLSNVETVTESVEGLSYLNNIKIFLVVFFALWGIAVIVSRFVLKDKQQKEDLAFTHQVIFGNTGIVPFIIYIWVVIITIVILIPLLSGVLPKVGRLIDSLTNLVPK